jgi:hypothetical protein
MLTDPNGKDPLAECIALLGALAVADGPLPVGDTAGLIACAAIFIGGSYTALWVTQQIPQVQQELGQCTITWQYLYTRVQPQPKKGPIKIPWWPTDNDDKKQKIKDISLGLAEVGPQPALFMFTTALNAKLNRINVYVYSNKDWFKEGLTDEVNPANFYLQFNQATQRASKIHFNLQGIDDPVAYANNMGATGFGDSSNYFTAVELYQIKESPALCQKTSFYKDASHSLIPSQSLKNLLC